MGGSSKRHRLMMLASDKYVGVNKDDPIRFYRLPLIGGLYRKRVERCLDQLAGGERILEVGFGAGCTFPNLNEMYDEIHGIDLTADTETVTSVFKGLGIRTFLKNGDLLNLPYLDGYFDAVLLISILEHLKPNSLVPAFREAYRVLKPGGQVVYGVPIDKSIMNHAFRVLGFNIKAYHFSDQNQIREAAAAVFKEVSVSNLRVWPFGSLYEVGHFVKHCDRRQIPP